MTYDDWKTTPPGDDEPDVEACGHRVGTCEGECRMDTDPAPALEEESGMSEQNYEREIRRQDAEMAQKFRELLRRDWAVRVLDLLAARERAAYERGRRDGAEPFVALMLWERDDYRSVVVEHKGNQDGAAFTLSYADEGDDGGSADGDTPHEAATNLCRQLGLMKGEK